MKFLFAILSATILALGVNNLFAADYYVAPNGNNANPGSINAPWKTIGKATASLQPGDTVYIREGIYQESLKPGRSGSSENQRITYAAFPNEKPVIRRVSVGINITNKSYITIDGIAIDGEKIRTGGSWPGVNKGSSNIQHFSTLTNSHHIIIQNVHWKYAHGWHGLKFDTGSHHNKLLNSRIDFVGTYDNGKGDDPGDAVKIERDSYHNLIEGNTLTHGGHNVLSIEGRYNVIRNNTFNNDWSGTGFGNNVGNRSVVLKGEGKPGSEGGFNVFEDNILIGTKASSDDPGPPVMKAVGQGQIVRRNFYYGNSDEVIVTSVGRGASNGRSDHNRIYNNVFYNNGGAAWVVSWNIKDGISLNDNIFKNNIVFKNRRNPDSSALDAEINFKNDRKSLSNNYVVNNLIMKSREGDAAVYTVQSGNDRLSWYQGKYTNNFAKNIQTNPMFVATTPSKKEDFQLDPASPAIDAGDYLTETSAAGTGSTIPVKDPYYFSDGYGIVNGDLIKVGNNDLVYIVSIDYKNKTIRVDKSIAWSAGDPVSLNYSGQAPDLGAYESGLTDASSGSVLEPPLPPTNLELITN